jgi:hypothetical protein
MPSSRFWTRSKRPAKTANPRRQKEFAAAVKKAETAKSLGKAETADALFEIFNEGIEADPEEEFHRAIQRMGVQYACSFETTGDDSGETTEPAEAPVTDPAAATPQPTAASTSAAPNAPNGSAQPK